MTVRKTMRTCMGLNPTGGHDEMPLSLADDNGAPVFWIEKDGERLLRPNWTLTWDDNARGWGKEIACKIQTSGKNFYGSADTAMLSSLPLDTVLNAIHTFFATCRSSIHSLSKPKAQQEQCKTDKRLQSRKRNVLSSFVLIVIHLSSLLESCSACGCP
jgi:hypothetical protein